MKKALVSFAAGAALVATAGVANADGYSYGSVKDAAAVAAPQPNWNGLYIGAAVGYGIASTDLNAVSEGWGSDIDGDYYYATAANLDGISSEGFQGVLTLGYDRQVHPNLLIGVFADYAFGDLDTKASLAGSYWDEDSSGSGGLRLNANINSSWAIGARLGLVRSATMWYVAGGYAQADLDWKATAFDSDLGSVQIGAGGKSLNGWFIGGGVEHQLRENLFLKLDYRYTSYDKVRLAYDEDSGADWEDRSYLDSQTDVHSVRLGVNWKVDLFGGRHGAPAYDALK